MKRLMAILLVSLVALGLAATAGCGGKDVSGTYVYEYLFGSDEAPSRGDKARPQVDLGEEVEGVVELELKQDGTYVMEFSDIELEGETIELGTEEGTYQVEGDTVKLVPEEGSEATFEITDEGLEAEQGAVWEKK